MQLNAGLTRVDFWAHKSWFSALQHDRLNDKISRSEWLNLSYMKSPLGRDDVPCFDSHQFDRWLTHQSSHVDTCADSTTVS